MKLSFQSFLLATLALSAAVLSVGCQAKSAPVAADETPKPAAGASSSSADTVEIDASMAGNIKVERVRSDSAPRVLTATGKIQINEDQVARVLAPLPGQVVDLKLHVGDRVEKDSVLFQLKSREVAGLVTDLVQAQHDQSLAEKSFTMTKDLFDHQAAARVALQQAESDLNKSKAQVARAEEALRVLGLEPSDVLGANGLRSLIPVHCPMSGTVIERAVTPGQFVQGDNTPLITIVDLNTVWVMVDVFETDIRLIQPGQRVEITATAYPDKHFSAQVERISDKVDSDTRTLKVRLLVANPGLLLKPEMFVSASVVVNERSAAVVVPAKALFTEGDRAYAFVAIDDRHFSRRQVIASADPTGRRLVTSGLHPGDKVVADGALLLRFRQTEGQDK